METLTLGLILGEIEVDGDWLCEILELIEGLKLGDTETLLLDEIEGDVDGLIEVLGLCD